MVAIDIAGHCVQTQNRENQLAEQSVVFPVLEVVQIISQERITEYIDEQIDVPMSQVEEEVVERQILEHVETISLCPRTAAINES